jgi:hypothetical protein
VFRWAAHGIALRDAPAQRSRGAQSHGEEWLFRAVEKSADACFDLRESCNEDAAVQVDACASTATCSARYIGVTCFRKLAGRKRGPAWRQCCLLSAAGVEQAAHAVLGRRAYRVERAATHRLRLLIAVVGACGALNERGGLAIRREERRRAAARGERARHRDDDRKRRGANPMHDARRGCLTAFHGKPRWPLVFRRTRLCHGRVALRYRVIESVASVQ